MMRILGLEQLSHGCAALSSTRLLHDYTNRLFEALKLLAPETVSGDTGCQRLSGDIKCQAPQAEQGLRARNK